MEAKLKQSIRQPITSLAIDLANLISDPSDRRLIDNLCAHKTPNELSRITWQFMNWLLMDPREGLINRTSCVQVKASVTLTATDVIAPRAAGEVVATSTYDNVRFANELVRARAWHAFKFSINTTPVRRIEWMIAVATFNSVYADRYDSLSGALHAAAVAWDSPSDDLGHQPGQKFYTSAFNKIISLFWNGIGIGDPVQITDEDDGFECMQTGVVSGLMNSDLTPPSVIVDIEHPLPGIVWHGPLIKLSKVRAA